MGVRSGSAAHHAGSGIEKSDDRFSRSVPAHLQAVGQPVNSRMTDQLGYLRDGDGARLADGWFLPSDRDEG